MKNLKQCYILLFGVLAILNACNSYETDNAVETGELKTLLERNSSWVCVEGDSIQPYWMGADQISADSLSGGTTSFYKNGKRHSRITYLDGKIDTVQLFDTSGILFCTKWTDNNGRTNEVYEKLGPFKRYYQNMKIHQTGNTIHIPANRIGNQDFLDGEIITYYENGDTASIEHFIDGGFKHGEFKTWHPNGQLDCVQHYLTNMRHGTYQKNSTDGTLEAEGSFNIGMGYIRSYYASGELKSKVHYYQHLKDGSALYYSLDGALTFSSTYQKDSLVSSNDSH